MNPSQTHIHIINKFGNAFGGSEQRALRLAQILQKHAVVQLWATHPPDRRFLAAATIKTIDPWRLSIPRTGTFIFVGAYFHIGHWIDLTRPERKIVVLNIDDAENAERVIERITAHGSNGCEVVYASEQLKSRFRYPGTVEDSPIDIGTFTPSVEARDRAFTVGRLSRNYRYKFHEEDPELFRRLDESGVRVRIMGGNCIAGDLPDTKNVEFIETGAIAAPDFLRSLDCFVYRTSRNWLESYGRVVFEAMASGLPVVCGRAGGYAGHIQNGVNGYLFDSNGEAIQIIEQLRHNPVLRRKIGDAARVTVEQIYSTFYEQRLVDFYVGKSGNEN